MATITDVAQLAGVGIGTVSRVTNGSSAVSEATRRKVLGAVGALGYRPNRSARALSMGRTHTIGVVAPFVTHPSVVERLRGMVAALRSASYDLVLFDVESRQQRDELLPGLSRGDRTDGLLVVSLPLTRQEVDRFASAQVPLVLIDVGDDRLSSVAIDNVSGGRLATSYLLSLGHERIAFVGDPERNPFGFVSSRDRRRGYAGALTEAGLAIRPEYIRRGPHSRHVAHRLTEELLRLPAPPTAIFAASDTQALGVLEAATVLGLSVPGDLSVVGFDDIDVSPYVGLTTVRQPLQQSGARGVELLLEQIGPEPTPPEVVSETLPLELVVRRTAGGPTR